MSGMGVQSGMEVALLLNQEVSAVVTAMRQNSKWAMVTTRYTVRFIRGLALSAAIGRTTDAPMYACLRADRSLAICSERDLPLVSLKLFPRIWDLFRLRLFSEYTVSQVVCAGHAPY